MPDAQVGDAGAMIRPRSLLAQPRRPKSAGGASQSPPIRKGSEAARKNSPNRFNNWALPLQRGPWWAYILIQPGSPQVSQHLSISPGPDAEKEEVEAVL
eukprot:5281878-Pyramimonas_sp.AAC.1